MLKGGGLRPRWWLVMSGFLALPDDVAALTRMAAEQLDEADAMA
jgi:hypothetical protein